MQIGSNLLVLHQNSYNPYMLVMSARLLQLSDVARGLIYMHNQGMIHGDLKGVCPVKLNLYTSPQHHSSSRVISWLIKLGMPTLQILGLQFSLTQRFRVYAHKVALPDG